MTLTRECPSCGAMPGSPCMTSTGRLSLAGHRSRIDGMTRSPEQRERRKRGRSTRIAPT